jgi:delta 1-pyrroline-5-carboxylate dehydrogenase
VHSGKHRARLWCETCHPPRRKIQVVGNVSELAPRDPAPAASLVVATRTKLAARAADAEGVVVLALAASIEAGGHSGASLAALSREYGRALAAALADVEPAGGELVDGIDWGVS